ncbi:hypothetical protein KNG_43300 [Burkholderia pseudomallei]|nr:hypothetical protein KNG_43300 [Burkholderia pseudomallei]
MRFSTIAPTAFGTCSGNASANAAKPSTPNAAAAGAWRIARALRRPRRRETVASAAGAHASDRVDGAGCAQSGSAMLERSVVIMQKKNPACVAPE